VSICLEAATIDARPVVVSVVVLSRRVSDIPRAMMVLSVSFHQ
jgi:hypothetical protein